MMAKVEIYTRDWCGYCARAKRLLRERGAEFSEHDVGHEIGARDIMIERAGGRTSVPQIFIDGAHVGGCDDLLALDASGKLADLLNA
jgi:glutaredoxin 3